MCVGFEQIEEVEEDGEELAIHQTSKSCEQDFLQINKCTVVEESAIKLLAMRLVSLLKRIVLELLLYCVYQDKQ